MLRARSSILCRAVFALAALASIQAGGVVVGALSAVPALAQTSDITLENLAFRFGDLSYRAPRAEFRGTGLSRAELTRLLDPASPEPLAERVRRLEAASIVVPEIISEVATPQGRQLTTYRDALFSKVAAGKIATVSAESGAIETVDGKGAVRGGFGRFALEDLDLDLAVALFTTAAAPDQPLRRIYSAFSLDGLTFTDASGNPTRIGRVFGRDVSARPTSAGWSATLNALGASPDLKAASPEDRKRSLDALSDLFDAFAIGTMEATDITFGGKDGAGGRMGRLAFSGASGQRAAEVRIDGFEAGSADGRVRFSSLAFGGLSIGPLLTVLRDIGAAASPPSAAVLRGLVPLVGNVSMNGLEVDVPGAKSASPDVASQPTRIALGQVEVATGKAVDGIPSDIRLALRNVSFPISPNPTNDGLKQLSSLGYDRVETSMALSLGWNEAGQELLMREVSVDGIDMGAVILRAVLGNVSRDVFNPDTAVASVAALGATAKSAEIGLENRGLFERIIAREAKRQKRSPEDIRREYGMAAAVGIPAVLGGSPGAKVLAQAVAKFVAKPGRLVIQARAKQPTGYGFADFAAGPDPASVLNALEITATAE